MIQSGPEIRRMLERKERRATKGMIPQKPKSELIYGLTIKQPWAELIARGHKSIETREWSYVPWRPKAGDLLAIHAGSGIDSAAFAGIRRRHPGLEYGSGPWSVSGAVLAVGKLASMGVVSGEVYNRTERKHRCEPMDLLDFENRFTQPGGPRKIFIGLKNVVTLAAPIAMKGNQGFWKLDPLQAEMLIGIWERGLEKC